MTMPKATKLKAKRPDPKRALEHLRKAQEISDRYGGPTKGMTDEEIIASIKDKRNARWEAKFAART
jgi:hypothetical protein